MRATDSCVWENGCGSGSAAVGAAEALKSGKRETTVRVRQPGGTIRVAAVAEKGRILSLSITGQVKTGPEESIQV